MASRRGAEAAAAVLAALGAPLTPEALRLGSRDDPRVEPRLLRALLAVATLREAVPAPAAALLAAERDCAVLRAACRAQLRALGYVGPLVGGGSGSGSRVALVALGWAMARADVFAHWRRAALGVSAESVLPPLPRDALGLRPALAAGQRAAMAVQDAPPAVAPDTLRLEAGRLRHGVRLLQGLARAFARSPGGAGGLGLADAELEAQIAAVERRVAAEQAYAESVESERAFFGWLAQVALSCPVVLRAGGAGGAGGAAAELRRAVAAKLAEARAHVEAVAADAPPPPAPDELKRLRARVEVALHRRAPSAGDGLPRPSAAAGGAVGSRPERGLSAEQVAEVRRALRSAAAGWGGYTVVAAASGAGGVP